MWPATSPIIPGRADAMNSTSSAGHTGRIRARRSFTARWPGSNASCTRPMTAAITPSSWARYWPASTALPSTLCSSSAAASTLLRLPAAEPGIKRLTDGDVMTAGKTTSASIPPSVARPGRKAGSVPPGPPMRELPSLMRKLWFDRISLLSDAAAEYGDAVRYRMGPKTLYFFNHPDHAKRVLADNAANYHKGMGLTEARRVLGDGLLTSEGDLWRRQRRTIQPVMRRERVADLTELIVDEAHTLIARLEAHVDGEPVDVVAEMTRLTLGVVGRGLLGSDLARYGDLSAAFEAVQDQAMFEMVTLRMLPLWLPLRKHRHFRAALAQLAGVASSLVARHEEGDQPDQDDVITRLVDAYRDEPDASLRRSRLQDE